MCKYCENGAEPMVSDEHRVFDTEFEVSMWIDSGHGELYTMINDNPIIVTKGIKYCPFCGEEIELICYDELAE